VVMFDEPLTVIDPHLKWKLRSKLKELHQRVRATMIYVTHDQTEAMTLADRIVVLRDGQVEQIGTPMTLYNDPANRFVAGFIGAPSMNFLDAARIGGDEGVELGLRPEHIRIVDQGRIAARVAHVENLGSDTNVIAEMDDGQRITLRLFGQHAIAADTDIQLDFEDAQCFRFDPQGRRIRPDA